MGWFGKKKDKKEKSVPFWRRGRETENLVETDAPVSYTHLTLPTKAEV